MTFIILFCGFLIVRIIVFINLLIFMFIKQVKSNHVIMKLKILLGVVVFSTLFIKMDAQEIIHDAEQYILID